MKNLLLVEFYKDYKCGILNYSYIHICLAPVKVICDMDDGTEYYSYGEHNKESFPTGETYVSDIYESTDYTIKYAPHLNKETGEADYFVTLMELL